MKCPIHGTDWTPETLPCPDCQTTTNPSTTDWEKEFDRLPTEEIVEKRDMGVKVLHKVIYKDQAKDFIESLLSRKEEEVLKDVMQAVNNNAGQEIIEMGNATDPIYAANHKGYMTCIEHTEVILRKRLEAATHPKR